MPPSKAHSSADILKRPRWCAILAAQSGTLRLYCNSQGVVRLAAQ